MANPTKWEELETWLIQFGHGHRFTAAALAGNLGIDVPEASALIQSYLGAQRAERYLTEDAKGKKVWRGGSNTLFVLHRVPGTRTTATVWEMGHRTLDAQALTAGFQDDVRMRIMRALEPDLKRVGARNPRARAFAEKRLDILIGSVLPIMQIALDTGTLPDDDEDDE